MVDTAVVPDSNVVLRLPAETDLEVMVLDNKLDKPVEEVLALFLGKTMDLLDVMADGKDRLPACHRIGANNRVDRLEDIANILRSAALTCVDLKVVALGCIVEKGLSVVGRKSVEKAAESGRDAVVKLIARSPEGVTPSLGELCQAKQGIVTWNGLKGNIRVPLTLAALSAIAKPRALEAVGVELLGLLR